MTNTSCDETVYIILHTKDHGRFESDAMPMTYQESQTLASDAARELISFLRIPVNGGITTIPSEILKTSIIQVFRTNDKH